MSKHSSTDIDRNIRKLREMGATDDDIMDMVKDELREVAQALGKVGKRRGVNVVASRKAGGQRG